MADRVVIALHTEIGCHEDVTVPVARGDVLEYENVRPDVEPVSRPHRFRHVDT